MVDAREQQAQMHVEGDELHTHALGAQRTHTHAPHEGATFTYIDFLLHQFEDVMLAADSAPFENVDAEYMRMKELTYLFVNLRELLTLTLYRDLLRADQLTVGLDEAHAHKRNRTSNDREDYLRRYDHVVTLISSIEGKTKSRLAATITATRAPRILQLCEKYRLTPQETDLFHVMTVTQGTNERTVLDSLVDEDSTRRILGYRRLTGSSEVDVNRFCDESRTHIKEGLVIVDEDHGVHFSIRIPRTAVFLLYGRQVHPDDLLKVSQTTLEDIIKEEGNISMLMSPEEMIPSKKLPTSTSFANPLALIHGMHVDQDSPLKGLIDSSPHGTGRFRSPRGRTNLRRIASADARYNGVHNCGVDNFRTSGSSQEDLTDMVEDTQTLMDTSVPSVEAESSKLNKAYSTEDQLEFLDDCFVIVGLMIRASAARMKDDMKREGMSSWETGGEMKHGHRELHAKIRMHESKIMRRLAATRNESGQLPRLEILADRFSLDKFEKLVILLVIGKTVSPIVKTLLDTLEASGRGVDEFITVGQALIVLCENFQAQVAKRMYFYKSSKLIKHGIISLTRSRWHQGSGDLTDQKINLDRRVLDWVVGLDSEINELVEGSDLYEPKVSMEQVILPEVQKSLLLEQCRAYEGFMKFREKSALDVVLPYGNGLVIMFCGPSGTGKTMTVNAMAKELNKKVLLVDFPSLTGRKTEGDLDADLRGLFREAEMNNAVLFFDECESVFKSRDIGPDRLLNSLLTEIERHQGIVFLATNRPFELDEAMHRRISTVVEFRSPDHSMRKRIWERLLQDARVPTDDSLDLDALAVKYELTGGFIKNAVLSALLRAISRNADNPLVQHEDLIEGCKLQMRGSLKLRSIGSSEGIPDRGLDDVILSEVHRTELNKLIRFEKARSTVYGTWRGDIHTDVEPMATIMLFLGPSGSGKRTVAKALGYDLGRPVRLVHVAHVIGSSLGESMRGLDALVSDARLTDGLLILDGFENVLEDASAASDTWRLHMVLSRLLEKLQSFPGTVILLAHVDNSAHVTLQREMASKLFGILRFSTPSYEMRASMWRCLLPRKAPLSTNVDFEVLGRKFELYPSAIASACVRAAAEAAMNKPPVESNEENDRRSHAEGHSYVDTTFIGSKRRRSEGDSADKRVITQDDLVQAGEAEVKKQRGAYEHLLEGLFV